MNEIQIKEYDLPDSYLYKNNADYPQVKVWIPDKECIVLGRSNDPDSSLNLSNIIEDKIPVYKRPSGGETVILTPNTLVISIAIRQINFKGGRTYFNIINNRIKGILKDIGVRDIELRGISDIAINNIKILGSALYQNKDIVFYHAVLNVSESTDLIVRYIKHPQREPDYRENRSHQDFVTSLMDERYSIPTNQLISLLEKELQHINFPSN
jgi:lipoate-protein ligase A